MNEALKISICKCNIIIHKNFNKVKLLYRFDECVKKFCDKNTQTHLMYVILNERKMKERNDVHSFNYKNYM